MTKGFPRALSALMAVLAVLTTLGFVQAQRAAATAAPTWASQLLGDPSSNDDDINLQAVSCATATYCVAAGSYDTTGNSIVSKPFVATWTGGSTWAESLLPTPSGYLYARLRGISCTSPTFCMAIGSNQTTGGSNNTFAEMWDGTTWTVQGPFSNGGAFLTGGTGISCTTSSACVATAYAENGNNTYRGQIYTYTGNGSWANSGQIAPASPPTYVNLSGISCTDATHCTAVGSTGTGNGTSLPLVEELSGSTWTASAPAAPSFSGNDAFLNSVWCSAAGKANCIAVGTANTDGEGFALPLDGSSATALDPDNNGSDTRSISCASLTSCTVGGLYYGSDSTQHALVETLAGGSWSASPAFDPSGHDSPRLDGVSCAGGYCAGAGSVDGEELPMVARPTSPPPVQTASKYAVSAPSTATAGAAFNVTVTAQDSGGSTVTGYSGSQTITFSGPSSSPGGTAPTYPATVSFTNGVGTASVTLTDAQSTAVTATDGSLTGTSGSVTVSHAARTKLTVAVGATQTEGVQATATLTALDAYGNTDTSLTGSQAVTFSGPGSAPDGTAPAYPASVTFSSGAGQAGVTLDKAETTALTATAGGVTGTSGSVTVNPGAAASLAVTGLPAGVTAGDSTAVTVTAHDNHGNTATGYTGTVGFTSSDAQATLPANGSASGGVLTRNVTLKTAGSQSVTATDTVTSSLTGQQSTTVSPDSTDHWVVSAPAAATAGTPVNVSVADEDEFGNPVPLVGDFSLAVTGPATSPGGTAPTYPSTVSLTDGQGSFDATLTDAQTTQLSVSIDGAAGTSGDVKVAPGTAAALALSGLSATTTAGSATTVTVTATDAYGNTATSYAGTLHVSSSDAAAVLPANLAATNGVATADVTLKTAGSQTVSATDTATAALTDTATTDVVAAAPASFTVTAPATAVAGTPVDVDVTALDAFGNTATGYTGSQALTFSGPSTSPGGTAPTYPATVTFTKGAGTASVTLTDAQSTAVTATQGGVTGTSATVTVSPAGPSSFTVTGLPSSTTAGDPLTATLTALDAYGNTATGATGPADLSFSGPDTAPGGTAPTYPASVTFTAGVGTATVVLTDAETTALTATVATITGTSAPVEVEPGTASALALTGLPSTVTAGDGQTLTATATDTYGNVATGYTGTLHVTSTDAAAGLPADTAATAGVASLPVTLKTAGGQSVTAGDGSLTASASTTVSPAAAASFVVRAPSAATAGTAFDVGLTALDAFGNPAAGYTGDHAVTFTGPDASPDGTAATYPATVTFTAGSGTASVTLTDAEAAALTATAGGVTGTSGDLLVGPAAAASVTLAGLPAGTTAGDAQTLTATAHDAYGNVATGYAGTLHLTSSDAQAALGPDTAAADGVAQLTATLKTTGVQTVTATDTATATLTDTEHATVSPAAAVGFTVATPATAVAGQPAELTVTAVDAFGNTASAYSGEQALTFSGPSAAPGGQAPVYPASVTFAGGTGTATVTLTDAQSTALTVTQDALTGTSGTVQVSPATLASITVHGPATTTAGTPTAFTATGFDTYGNTTGDVTGSTTFTASGGGTCVAANCTVTVATGHGLPVTVTGTDGTFSSGTQVQVTPGPLATVVVETGPAGQNGDPIGVSVIGSDAYGNIIGDVTPQATLTISPDGTCTATTCTPATGGPHSISATVATPGGSTAASTASSTTVPGYHSPSIQKLLLHLGDGLATATYATDTFGALPVTIRVTATAKGHPTHTAYGSSSSGVITVKNLTDGVKYTFVLTVTTAQGTASTAPAGAGTPARVPRLTLSAAHRTVSAGTADLLSGTIVVGKTPVANRVVILTATQGKSVTVVGRVRTDRHGKFHLTVRPKATTSYTATAVFGPKNDPTISRNKPLRVSVR